MRQAPATTQSGLPFDTHLSRSERQQRLSQHAPTGMNTWEILGWSSSHVAVDLLRCAERLSAITAMPPGRVGVLDQGDAVSGGGGHLMPVGRPQPAEDPGLSPACGSSRVRP